MLAQLWPLLWRYLLTVNLAAFVLMGVDKRSAKKGRRRISERTLFLAALLGGALGGAAGMHAFGHKTRHWYFRLGLPALLIAEILLGLCLWILLPG